jgi:hypothetical protein
MKRSLPTVPWKEHRRRSSQLCKWLLSVSRMLWHCLPRKDSQRQGLRAGARSQDSISASWCCFWKTSRVPNGQVPGMQQRASPQPSSVTQWLFLRPSWPTRLDHGPSSQRPCWTSNPRHQILAPFITARLHVAFESWKVHSPCPTCSRWPGSRGRCNV